LRRPIGHQDHNDWIEKEDFDIFLHAILMTHPGLEFLLETQAGDGLAAVESVEIPEAQTFGRAGCTHQQHH